MKPPFWIALLDSWCRKKTGLSLPFLVGATAIHKGMSPDATFAGAIMTYIRNNNEAGTYFRIAHCGLTGVPIIATDTEKLEQYQQNAQLLIQKGYFSRVPDYPTFSWSRFTEDDLKFIDSVSRTY